MPVADPGAPWQPEHEIDSETASRLIAEQFPELLTSGGGVEVSRVGHGWDNTVLRVNRDWGFRFPRRQLGANLVETEVAVLPRLAPRL